MAKRIITAEQHARLVMASHAAPSAQRAYSKEFTTFARPDESQADAIKRYMRARRAKWRKAPAREFPKTQMTLASTRAYVEAYYQINMAAIRGAYADREVSTPQYARDMFGELSTNPTTWLEGDEVVEEKDFPNAVAAATI
jgi:hypothetical protein